MKASVKVVFDVDSPKHNLSLGERQVMFVRHTDQNIGMALEMASDADRAEFGFGVFRIGAGETRCMDGHIVKVNLESATLQFISQEDYLEGKVVWGARLKLPTCIVRNTEECWRAYNADAWRN